MKHIIAAILIHLPVIVILLLPACGTFHQAATPEVQEAQPNQYTRVITFETSVAREIFDELEATCKKIERYFVVGDQAEETWRYKCNDGTVHDVKIFNGAVISIKPPER